MLPLAKRFHELQVENAIPPSFTSYLLDHQREFDLTDEELAYLAGSMFGAGSDTVRIFSIFVSSRLSDVYRPVPA